MGRSFAGSRGIIVQKKKAAPEMGRPLFAWNQQVGLELEVREVTKAAVELTNLTTGINQALNTGPGWV